MTSQPQKILIVDDEAYIRLLIEQALEDLEEDGVEIFHAGDGDEALRLVQEEQPRLVFLDVMIPNRNGFEVCRVIKHELKLKDVFVVILTAKGQRNDRQLSEEAGADIFLTKSFDPDELLALTKKVLEL
jgi:DNA-binding response OmpR family regulator